MQTINDKWKYKLQQLFEMLSLSIDTGLESFYPLVNSPDNDGQFAVTPLTSNRHHLSYDDCLENKGRLQDCSCSIGSYHCIQCYAHIL